IGIRKLAKHSLMKDTLEVPVGGITALTGKSGIGKTTLVKDILIPSIQTDQPVNCESIVFPKSYTGAQYFEPKILRSHASTLLVSYLNLLKDISKIFASETSLKAKDFSYKTKSSQCSNCKGKGYLETSLDVAANVIEKCEVCKGQRYQPQILAPKVQSKNIAEVLALNITELKAWLEAAKVPAKTLEFLNQLDEIGLAHLSLDQPVQSLSSGEKQRLLLLNWLQEQTTGALYILDEPSTGLHYADIDLLYAILQKLSEANDILIIDHNLYLLGKIEFGVVLE
ncbi:MAG: ATP-binding cassette domain-containing protein, partial [Mesonia sp.]